MPAQIEAKTYRERGGCFDRDTLDFVELVLSGQFSTTDSNSSCRCSLAQAIHQDLSPLEQYLYVALRDHPATGRLPDQELFKQVGILAHAVIGQKF